MFKRLHAPLQALWIMPTAHFSLKHSLKSYQWWGFLWGFNSDLSCKQVGQHLGCYKLVNDKEVLTRFDSHLSVNRGDSGVFGIPATVWNLPESSNNDRSSIIECNFIRDIFLETKRFQSPLSKANSLGMQELNLWQTDWSEKLLRYSALEDKLKDWISHWDYPYSWFRLSWKRSEFMLLGVDRYMSDYTYFFPEWIFHSSHCVPQRLVSFV